MKRTCNKIASSQPYKTIKIISLFVFLGLWVCFWSVLIATSPLLYIFNFVNQIWNTAFKHSAVAVSVLIWNSLFYCFNSKINGNL